MEEELIDRSIEETPKDILLDILRWWERKRILFNLINIGIIILVFVTFYFDRPEDALFNLNAQFFILSFLYFLFINACYCAGWVVQFLGYYYFKIQHGTKGLDYVLFVIGTLFTGLVTYGGYYDYVFLRIIF